MSETIKAWTHSTFIDLSKKQSDLYKDYCSWLYKRKLNIQPVNYVTFKLFILKVRDYMKEDKIELKERKKLELQTKLFNNESKFEISTTDQKIQSSEIQTKQPDTLEELPWETVFQQIENYTESICDINSTDYSLIVSGDSGLGKTVTVKSVLTKKLKEESQSREFFVEEDLPEGTIYETLSQEEQIEDGEYKLTWIEAPTKITVQQLYIYLYRENGKVLLFDDADILIENPQNFDILKKVLDSKKTRTVGYGSKPIYLKGASQGGNTVQIPNQFEFTGRVIVITNKSFSKIDDALKSRSLVVELNLSAKECLRRVKCLLPELGRDDKRVTSEIKNEVLEYLLSISNLFEKIDLRTVEQSIKERLRSPNNWKDLIKRSIIIKNK